MRQLILPHMPSADGNIILSGKDFRYLYSVLRLRPDMLVDVRFPSGALTQMKVVATDLVKKTIELRTTGENLTGKAASGGEKAITENSLPETVLLQFLPKLTKMDTILRQAVEVGVSSVIPLVSRFSPIETQNAVIRLERWQRIIREARQQSGSPVATHIFEPQTLENALKIWQKLSVEKTVQAVYLSEEQHCETSLHDLFAENVSIAAIAVGSEGGYAPEEIDALVAAGFKPLHFNTNILRAETAALYGLAALQIVRTELAIWKK